MWSFFQMGELRHLQTRIQQGSDDALLPHCLAGLRQASRFLGPPGLALELVRHRTSATGAHPHDIRTEPGSACAQAWATGAPLGTSALKPGGMPADFAGAEALTAPDR
jgi:hypothetical protein